MDGLPRFLEALPMAKAKTRVRAPEKNYLAEWMAWKDVKAADLARAAHIGESHISLVLSGGRGLGVVSAKKIAAVWGVNYLRLYEPPEIGQLDLAGLTKEDIAAMAAVAATLRSRR